MALTEMDKVITNGTDINSTPLSRSEALLKNVIDGNTDDGTVIVDGQEQQFVPQSRIEALLRAIPGGGGGGVTEARVKELIQIATDNLIDDAPSNADTLNELNNKILALNAIEITQAEYDALSDDVKMDGKVRYIKD